jgi:hypothetical protein
MSKRQLLSILIIGLICFGCHLYGPPPGEGPKAERLFKEAAPIIDALEQYRSERGSYPKMIGELIPRYLHEMPSETFSYAPENESYILAFRYEGPGINSCVFSPGKGWHCTGLI